MHPQQIQTSDACYFEHLYHQSSRFAILVFFIIGLWTDNQEFLETWTMLAVSSEFDFFTQKSKNEGSLQNVIPSTEEHSAIR
jgi:hypothetical protein